MSKKLTLQEFILRATSIHNNKYSYTKTIYNKNSDKVIIECPKHGEFFQKASHHLNGHGCSKCGDESVRSILTMPLMKFKKDCSTIYNNKYNYDNVSFLNLREKIELTCPKHGKFFQSAYLHLKGNGCRKCVFEKVATSTEEFILKAKAKHGERYDYSKVNYKNVSIKVQIFCKIHNDFFFQDPHSHLKGSGCPLCNNNGTSFIKTQWIRKANGRKGTFYIIRCWNEYENFFKFGITYRDKKLRYNTKIAMPYNYEFIKLVESYNLSYIWDLEKRFSRFIRKHKYLPKISFGGSKRECYIKN